jgi:hypothetical protein
MWTIIIPSLGARVTYVAAHSVEGGRRRETEAIKRFRISTKGPKLIRTLLNNEVRETGVSSGRWRVRIPREKKKGGTAPA